MNGSHLQWQDVVKELPLISIEEKLGREIPTWSRWLKNPHYGKEWQEWSIDEDIGANYGADHGCVGAGSILV